MEFRRGPADEHRPKQRKTTRGVLALMFAAAMAGIFATQMRWWLPASAFEVLVDRKPWAGTEVWRSGGGALWVCLPGEGGYLIDPQTREVRFTNSTLVRPVGPVGVSDPSAPKVLMPGKTGVVPRLLVEPGWIEFDTVRRKRVRLTWRE